MFAAKGGGVGASIAPETKSPQNETLVCDMFHLMYATDILSKEN